jgi:hypothetical protein
MMWPAPVCDDMWPEPVCDTESPCHHPMSDYCWCNAAAVARWNPYNNSYSAGHFGLGCFETKRIGALCETKHAMGIRQRIPLWRDVLDLLLCSDDDDNDDDMTSIRRRWIFCQAVGTKLDNEATNDDDEDSRDERTDCGGDHDPDEPG